MFVRMQVRIVLKNDELCSEHPPIGGGRET
jgi:hypothetical protein